MGCEVVVADNGLDALEAAARFEPAVVVLDMLLPRMDGFETAQRLKTRPARQRPWIIGLSANGRAREAIEAGCDQFLWKPFQLDELLVAVEAGLAHQGGGVLGQRQSGA